jgi:hypothetical protein
MSDFGGLAAARCADGSSCEARDAFLRRRGLSSG